MMVDATEEPADLTVEARLLALRTRDRKLGKNRPLFPPLLLGDEAISLMIPP
jgi:hypothetical protein